MIYCLSESFGYLVGYLEKIRWRIRRLDDSNGVSVDVSSIGYHAMMTRGKSNESLSKKSHSGNKTKYRITKREEKKG